MFVHLLQVKLSTFLPGRPRAVPELDQRPSSPIPVRVPAAPLTTWPAAARGARGQENEGETKQ